MRSLPPAGALRDAAALLLAVTLAIPLGAQTRRLERHSFESPEGRLLGFYSAALAYTAVGPAQSSPPWSFDVGAEGAYVPYLTRERRTAGSDKPQSSNLAPAFPRPRVALALPGEVYIEASWIPPVRVFDAQASIISVGIARPFGDVRGVTLMPRVAFSTGRIEGAITCNEELDAGTQDQQVYYANVCQGRESEDHFEPRHVSIELMASRAVMQGLVVPFGSVGARRERVRFDIGVIRPDGSRETDHPILEMEATRPFATAGARWQPHSRIRTGAEVFYAPGSLVTGRIIAMLSFARR